MQLKLALENHHGCLHRVHVASKLLQNYRPDPGTSRMIYVEPFVRNPLARPAQRNCAYNYISFSSNRGHLL